ncbi:MAG: hypothetical protein R3A52_09370 [Polyangiales bacterium]
MKFKNLGGTLEYLVRDEEDLARLDEVDPARWAATSAPVDDLHCDKAFLRLIGATETGRVRVSHVLAARDWAFARLARKGVLREKTDSVPIEAIDPEGDAGKKLRAAAARVNAEQGAKDEARVALADVRAFRTGSVKRLANGDGVIPPELVTDDALKDFIKDVMVAVGGTADRSGTDGVSKALLDRFETRAKDYLSWRSRAEAAQPWGADTGGAREMVAAMAPRIEAWFLYSELLRQEAPGSGLRLTDEEFRALRAKALADVEKHLVDAPLAAPVPSGALRLDAEVNALHRHAFEALRDKVLLRALGESERELTRDGWARVKAIFEPFAQWEREKPEEPFEKIGDEKLKGYLDGPLPAKLAELIAKDSAAQADLDQVDDLEKLVLCARWLIELANNLVNFSRIYDPEAVSLVECGSLVIDGRRLEFCLRVQNRAAHKVVATESKCFLVYAKLTSKEAGGETYEVVAPVTGGERGRLRVGKRGIFIDVDDKEWDAVVVDVVENPISVREGAIAPFRRAATFISTKFEEWVGSKADAQQSALTQATERGVASATTAANTVGTRPATPAPAAGAARPAAPAREPLNINSLIIGGGVAMAGLGAVLATVFSALTSLNGWIAIVGLVLAVILVSAFVAWLKLIRRDMSLILEANGWAVNAQMKITRRIAKLFAFTPKLPRGASIDRTEVAPRPNAEDDKKPSTALPLLLALLAVSAGVYAWYARGHAMWPFGH